MKKVTVLGCYNTMATTIFGAMDIFNQAGRLWNRIEGSEQTPFFKVTLASADGEPIKAANNVLIQPHCSIDEIDQTDLIIISSATFIDRILKDSPNLVLWLIKQYEQGAHIASICTGVFLLAETGLLDGRSATLHWGYTHTFKKKYPKIKLDHGRMFIDHGRLYCSAGVSAGMDLSLYLVEKLCGEKAAVQSAKTMILDLGRTDQKPYETYFSPVVQTDSVIAEIQSHFKENLNQVFDYNQMAKTYGLGRRSLERRFKKATGKTPLGYLQQLRVEKAKRLLEKKDQTFSQIAYSVGYEDVSFFRKIFVRHTGLLPTAYQKRFSAFSASHKDSQS